MQSIREEDFIALERAVWDAITKQDVTGFQALVAEDAWMVVGGMRSSGAEEAQFLPQIHFPPCVLSEFRVKALSEDVVLLHYTATFGGENSPSVGFCRKVLCELGLAETPGGLENGVQPGCAPGGGNWSSVEGSTTPRCE